MTDLPDRPLLRVDEVAEYWSISVRTVYLWIEHGHLEKIKTKSGATRITRASVLACRILNRTETVA